jgi:myo-inositol-1(or 4)-monophosphatase
MRGKVATEFKSALDPVTEADRASERFLMQALRQRYPDDGFLGEEGTERSGSSGYLWVADPLDGTVNFSHGNPHFAVSLGLLKDGRAVAGAVAHGASPERFTAELGAGAFRNGVRLCTSPIDTPDRALAATDFPYDRASRLGRGAARVRAFLGAFQVVRIQGSAALDICRIAAGELEVYAGDGTRPWDVAAATLILEEAGGRVTTWTGGPLDLMQPTFPLASNGPMHPFALTVMQDIPPC